MPNHRYTIITTRLIAALVACVLAVCVWAIEVRAGEPPTDAEIDRAIAIYRTAFAGGVASGAEVERAAKEALAGLDVSTMSGVQLARLMQQGSLMRLSGALEPATERLRTMLTDAGANGAAASVQLLADRLAPITDPNDRVAVLRETIAHPGLESAIRTGGADSLFDSLRSEIGPSAPLLWTELLGLSRLLTPELAPRLAPSYVSYYELLRLSAGKDADPDRRAEIERVRVTLVTLARGAGNSVPESSRTLVAEGAAYLDGAYVRGSLVGYPAPALEIIWASDPAIDSLDSLRGRVVILDFWATWCGPCVESFPHLAALREYYGSSPVTILGVTSPQGSVVGLDGGIVRARDEAHELELMRAYASEKSITWPLAVTRQPVNNPDYGVRGIPHMVIIDPAGVVRHRGLRPATITHEQIDAILREFELPTP